MLLGRKFQKNRARRAFFVQSDHERYVTPKAGRFKCVSFGSRPSALFTPHLLLPRKAACNQETFLRWRQRSNAAPPTSKDAAAHVPGSGTAAEVAVTFM